MCLICVLALDLLAESLAADLSSVSGVNVMCHDYYYLMRHTTKNPCSEFNAIVSANQFGLSEN